MRKTRSHVRFGIFGALLVASAFQLGCADDRQTTPSARAPGQRPAHPAEGEQQQQASAPSILTLTMQGVQLSQDQQNEVKRTRDDLHAKAEPTRAAEKALLLAIAEGVAAGSIDETKLAPAITNLATAGSTEGENGAAAINHLHELLKPDQRQAVADEVIGRWSTATIDAAKSDKFGRPDELRVLIKQLNMTPDQVDHVLMGSQTSMSGTTIDPWVVNGHLERIEAFRYDRFDAAVFTVDKAKVVLAVTEEAKRVTRLYSSVVPILTPPQRTDLAQRLRDRAAKATPPPP